MLLGKEVIMDIAYFIIADQDKPRVRLRDFRNTLTFLD